MLRRKLWMGLSIVAIAAAACATTTDPDFESPEEPTAVVIDVREGDITIRANSSSGTDVFFEESDATATATLDGGVLTISDDCTSDCRVNYRLDIGDSANVTIVLGEGNVSITDVDGTMSVQVDRGNVNLNTVVGSFGVDIATVGDILGARLEGSTGSFITADGSIDVTFDTAVTDLVVRSGKGDVTAQLAGGPYAVDATASGSTDILVDEDAAASGSVVISTDDGDATVYKK